MTSIAACAAVQAAWVLATKEFDAPVAESAAASCNECMALGIELSALLEALQLHDGQAPDVVRLQADMHDLRSAESQPLLQDSRSVSGY